MNLYKVRLVGLHSAIFINYQTSYVLAKDSSAAYKKVRKFLDNEDLGFASDRTLNSIELVAEDARYPESRTMLFR